MFLISKLLSLRTETPHLNDEPRSQLLFFKTKQDKTKQGLTWEFWRSPSYTGAPMWEASTEVWRRQWLARAVTQCMCDLSWSYLFLVSSKQRIFSLTRDKRVLILPCSSSASPLDGEGTQGILFLGSKKETPVWSSYFVLSPDDFKPFFIGNDGYLERNKEKKINPVRLQWEKSITLKTFSTLLTAWHLTKPLILFKRLFSFAGFPSFSLRCPMWPSSPSHLLLLSSFSLWISYINTISSSFLPPTCPLLFLLLDFLWLWWVLWLFCLES